MGIRGRLRDWGEIGWSYLLHGDIFRKLLLAIRNFDGNSDDHADISSRDRIKGAKISDLEWDGARAVWVATGRDPRLVIHGPFPPGFSPRHVSSYRVESGKLSIDEILPLRRTAIALRIDPINTQCDLKIDTLS